MIEGMIKKMLPKLIEAKKGFYLDFVEKCKEEKSSYCIIFDPQKNNAEILKVVGGHVKNTEIVFKGTCESVIDELLPKILNLD